MIKHSTQPPNTAPWQQKKRLTQYMFCRLSHMLVFASKFNRLSISHISSANPCLALNYR